MNRPRRLQQRGADERGVLLRAMLMACAVLALGAACTSPTPELVGSPTSVPVADTAASTQTAAEPETVDQAPARTLPWELPVDEERFISAASERFIEFKEVPPPVVHETLRIPQTDNDTAGALHRDIGSFSWQAELAGKIFDRCRYEDEFVGWYGRYPDSRFGEPTPKQRSEVNGSRARVDCRGQVAFEQPLNGYSPNRWFTFGDFGFESPSFRNRDEAVEWYEQRAAAWREQHKDTLPPFTSPLGFLNTAMYAGAEEYAIRYAPVDAPVEGVGVLSGSVSVSGGVLRGLVRNRSRTLWAYGVKVRAGDRVWSWPLSVSLRPPYTLDVSHPSLNGLWAPGVVERLWGYVAHVDHDGHLVAVSALTPFRDGHADAPPIVMRSYPPIESELGELPMPHVSFAFAFSYDTDWMFWIGGAHPPSG
ncbi:hypothetical protein [Candidatus Poriferisodalis sp.]|uniref:hypothetical protein n=1 Tax=Candidatus Poriferisodalis sp. TaxID=3101277 RepID=UPI003AF7CC21